MGRSLSEHGVELVVFDLGGVMVRLARRWAVACQRVGIDPPPGLDDPATIDAIRPVVDQNERGQLDPARFNAQVGAIVGLSADQLQRISTAWLVGPYPGIEALVDQLHAAQIKLACLSNTNAWHWQLLSTPGNAASLPLDRFDHHFVSHLIAARKPEPAIYQHVEQTTGLDPQRILFFDDLEANTAAAAQRGWQTLTIDPDRPVEQMTAHLAALGCL